MKDFIEREKEKALKQVDKNIKKIVSILNHTRGLTSILMEKINKNLEELKRQAEHSINAYGL